MGRSILVIDDDFFMRKLMEVMLSNNGHSVYLASDANEALDTLAIVPIDIITCDIMMPDVDGLNFLKRLKSNLDYNTIPVIIITAAGVQKTIQEALDSGACCVVEKPFTETDLQVAINRANSLD